MDLITGSVVGITTIISLGLYTTGSIIGRWQMKKQLNKKLKNVIDESTTQFYELNGALLNLCGVAAGGT